MKPPAIRFALALTSCLAALILIPLAAQDENETEPDPYEWVVETYSFPVHELIHGFATEERGALTAPRLPEQEMTDEEALDFLRKSNSIVSHYLKKQGLALPEGCVVIFDPVSLSLAARAPRITQSSISFTSAAFRENIETYLELNTVLLEGEAETIREQLERAGETADHTDLLRKLEAAVAQGTVSILQEKRIETRSGQRAKVDDSREFSVPADLALAPDGTVLYDSESYREGTTWEVDAVVGADRETIDLNLALHHHFAPSQRRQIFFTNAQERAISSAATEHSVASVTSQFTLDQSTTKLIGVWKPQSLPGGPEVPDRLQAGFVSADLVEVLPLINPRLSEILQKHADTIAKIPEGDPVFEKLAEEIPEGMIVRRFRIPPTFLSSSRAGNSSAADPFADPVGGEPTFTIRATAKDILMSAGIPFPEGSSANYLAENSTLVVRNKPENIALVEAYVMSINSAVEKALGFTAYLVEGPAATIREAIAATRGLANHVDAWESIAGNDAIMHLSSYWIEGRSGQRCRVKVAKDHYFPVSNLVVTEAAAAGKDAPKLDPVGTLSGALELMEIGASLEFDAVLGADETTVDLSYSFSYDYAPPRGKDAEPVAAEGAIELEGPITEFHRTSLVGSTTIRDGMIRFVGSWKPEGAPRYDQQDLLQAIFLKVDVVPVREEGE